jgi:hypothetical protein
MWFLSGKLRKLKSVGENTFVPCLCRTRSSALSCGPNSGKGSWRLPGRAVPGVALQQLSARRDVEGQDDPVRLRKLERPSPTRCCVSSSAESISSPQPGRFTSAARG